MRVLTTMTCALTRALLMCAASPGKSTPLLPDCPAPRYSVKGTAPNPNRRNKAQRKAEKRARRSGGES